MLFTPRRGISYPDPDRHDLPDIPLHLSNVALASDADVVYQEGPTTARDTAGEGGKWHRDSTTGVMTWDNGSLWVDPKIRIPIYNVAQFRAITNWYDGDECYISINAQAGNFYHVKYLAGISDAYKWIVIGGSPIFVADDTGYFPATGAGTWLAPGSPSYTIDLAGSYDVEVRALEQIVAGHYNTTIRASISAYASGSAQRGYSASFSVIDQGGVINTDYWQSESHKLSPGMLLQRAEVIAMQYMVSVAIGGVGFYDRLITLTPRRFSNA